MAKTSAERRKALDSGQLRHTREMNILQSSVAENSRTRTLVASDAEVDRQNTTVAVEGWDTVNYDRNPVVLNGHNWEGLPVGIGKTRVAGGKLLIDVEFLTAEENPEAERLLKILDRGIMGASVGFRIKESKDAPARRTGDAAEDFWNPPIDILKQELLEVSIVSIPSNPGTLAVGRSNRRLRSWTDFEPQPEEPSMPIAVEFVAAPIGVIDTTPEIDPIEMAEAEVVVEASPQEIKSLVARATAEIVQQKLEARRLEKLGITHQRKA